MAKAQRVRGLRHAQAGKAQEDGYAADIARDLSELGQTQALARRESLGSPTFVAVAASGALRTRRTAAIVSGRRLEDVTVIDAITAPDPESSDDARIIDNLFRELNYAAPRSYRRHNEEVMTRYGIGAWEGIRSFLEAQPEGDILIVGHAVLFPAAFFAGVSEEGERAEFIRAGLLDLQMPEAGGFELTLVDQVPVDLKILPLHRPPNTGIAQKRRTGWQLLLSGLVGKRR